MTTHPVNPYQNNNLSRLDLRTVKEVLEQYLIGIGNMGEDIAEINLTMMKAILITNTLQTANNQQQKK